MFGCGLPASIRIRPVRFRDARNGQLLEFLHALAAGETDASEVLKLIGARPIVLGCRAVDLSYEICREPSRHLCVFRHTAP
jgi:hypothetical protein